VSCVSQIGKKGGKTFGVMHLRSPDRKDGGVPTERSQVLKSAPRIFLYLFHNLTYVIFSMVGDVPVDSKMPILSLSRIYRLNPLLHARRPVHINDFLENRKLEKLKNNKIKNILANQSPPQAPLLLGTIV
jgi:hypothetical protein